MGHRGGVVTSMTFVTRGSQKGRVCRKCGKGKPLRSFTEVRPGCRRRTCIQCRKGRDQSQNPNRLKIEGARAWSARKERRRLGVDLEKFIYEDSRRSDKKKGFQNDLTLEFIKREISKGCSYCGEVDLRMSLDRIDNSIGHLQSNVQPACIRCNYARRSMPYAAWVCLIHGLREAREKGLFGNWTGRCR
jgi:hypothetical protein